MNFEKTNYHLAGAIGCVAAFHFAWREVTLKIADQVMVLADGAGLAETAAHHPWGAVDWLARILAATNLTGWGILVQLALVAAASAVAFCALKRRGSPYAPFAPWLAAALYVLPTLALGEHVWLLVNPHFPQLQLIWFLIFAGCLFAGGRGLLGFAALQIVLIALGRYVFYDLPAHETLKAAWGLPILVDWSVESMGTIIPFVLLAALACAKRPATLPKWSHAVAPGLFLLLFVIALPHRDCRDQLKMERAARDGRFDELLQIAPQKKRPERMETAWRILAMFRLDKLDHDLWRYPIVGSHLNTSEEELIMAGPLLLFQYGLIQPARRWIFESSAIKGWQPQYLRLLGDCALVSGEEELARKNFKQLARCPFRGHFARKRLETLSARPRPADAFADLSGVASLHRNWCDFASTPGAPVYYGDDRVVERFVYTLFQQLPSCPPPMLKMFFACALLEGKVDLLRGNQDALRQLYPDGCIGPVFRQALK